MDDRQTDARTGRKRGRRRRNKKKERARARVKKRGEFVTLIGDPGHVPDVGRGIHRGQRGSESKIQELGKTRGKNRGIRCNWKKKRNEPCGAWKESCKFFFLTKRGLRVRGATVGRRIDRSGSENRRREGKAGRGKGGRKDARVARGILTLFGRSTFINLYPEKKRACSRPLESSRRAVDRRRWFLARKHLHAFGERKGTCDRHKRDKCLCRLLVENRCNVRL